MTRQFANPVRLAVLAALLVFALFQLPGASRALDIFDQRPTVRILFIGNSHTAGHDMTGMVRKIADGAGLKQRLDITVYAPGGRRFGDHWVTPKVQELLKEKWDHVVLQGASGEPLNDRDLKSFTQYGEKLAKLAAQTGGKTWFYVTWAYQPKVGWMLANPWYEGRMHGLVQDAYRQLARKSGADLINVGRVWQQVHQSEAAFSLYEPDGNHASAHGAYLAALMMFTHITGESPRTSWRPNGISEADATRLQQAAGS